AQRRRFSESRVRERRSEIVWHARAGIAAGLLGCAFAVLLFACAGPGTQEVREAASSAPAQAGAASAGNVLNEQKLDEIMVTGSRVERSQADSPVAIAGVESMRRSAELLSQMGPPKAQIGTPAAGAASVVATGSGPLLSRVQPGEEIWVIQTAAPQSDSNAT